MRASIESPGGGERGATVVIVAIVLTVLCGFVALSLDVGHLFSVRGELQNGADAAALAGAKRLNGRKTELPGAKADAANFARNHPTDRWDVEPTTIELGAWLPPERTCGEVDGTERTPRPLYPNEQRGEADYKFCAIPGAEDADAANINAVRVITQRVGTPGEAGGGAVPLAFAPVVGQPGPQAVSAEAIAVIGGPCSVGACDLPFAIRQGCIFTDGALRCDATYFIGLSPAPEDTAGITSLNDDQSANGSVACDIVRYGGTCSASGDMINTQDGQDGMTSHCEKICPYGKGPKNVCEQLRFMADTGRGASTCDGSVDVGADGVPLWIGQVPIVLYPGDSETTCGGEDHNNKPAELVTWATAGVVSARCEPFDKLPLNTHPITKICDDEQLKGDPDSKGGFCIAIKLFCDQKAPDATSAGCLWAGTSPLQPVLVR